MKKPIIMNISGTFMLIIVLGFLCIPIANADFGWEQVVGGGAGAGNGFGDSNNYQAPSMTVFGDYLYVATVSVGGGGEVWRSSNGTTWKQVNTDGFGDANNDAWSVMVFGSYLYVGTHNATDGCEAVSYTHLRAHET